jgi:hypothetical protein
MSIDLKEAIKSAVLHFSGCDKNGNAIPGRVNTFIEGARGKNTSPERIKEIPLNSPNHPMNNLK